MSGKSSLTWSSTGCVLVHGGSSYANRSVIGCVPVSGSCLPGPGYTGVGISNANRSFIGFAGCVPAPGSCPPGPGYVGVGISHVNRSFTGFTGCVPAPGSGTRGPGVRWIGKSNLGLRFGPVQGPESALLSRIRCDDFCADGSPGRSVYPSVAGPVPWQPHEVGGNPSRFPVRGSDNNTNLSL